MFYNDKIIAKDVFTGGRLVRKYLKVGRGVYKPVRKVRDRFNRIIIRVGRGVTRNNVVKSAPRVSSKDVMNSIGNSLGNMNVGRRIRGRGVSIM